MDELIQQLCDGVSRACSGIPAEHVDAKNVTVSAGPVLELLRRAGFEPNITPAPEPEKPKPKRKKAAKP